jgi:carboxyl-terminal processing protease
LGGYLSQAVQVADLFISSGIIVISEYADGKEQVYRHIDGKSIYKGPLIILTSKMTASAAEIVSQALQDYGVALVVGDKHTYGKGTIQSQTVTGNASTGNAGTSLFKVTVGKYYTVSGKSPQLSGVQADIVAPSPLLGEPIGEEYLEYTESANPISPRYDDPLTDLNPQMKRWYLKYYSPHIQGRLTHWRDMLPTLQKNSQKRISNNKSYQAMIETASNSPPDLSKDVFTSSMQQFAEDVQQIEALQILKDMILLDSQSRSLDWTQKLSQPFPMAKPVEQGVKTDS